MSVPAGPPHSEVALPAAAPSNASGQRDPTFDLASQNKDLMPQQGILGDELTPRPEGRSQDGQQERQQRDHRKTIDDSIRL